MGLSKEREEGKGTASNAAETADIVEGLDVDLASFNSFSSRAHLLCRGWDLKVGSSVKILFSC